MKIEVKAVTKKFRETVVLDDINLEFLEGNIYGLFGRNGSGKSVLLKLICGFYVPTNGEILYDGINYNAKLEYPKDLRALNEFPTFVRYSKAIPIIRKVLEIEKDKKKLS